LKNNFQLKIQFLVSWFDKLFSVISLFFSGEGKYSQRNRFCLELCQESLEFFQLNNLFEVFFNLFGLKENEEVLYFCIND